MIIGIDIDGVLNSQYNFCIDYGSKFCNELGKYKLENINVIDTTDMFLWSNDMFPDNLKEDVEGITKKWMEENKIYYDKIIFNVKNKGECKWKIN